jgi:hypothetical protein
VFIGFLAVILLITARPTKDLLLEKETASMGKPDSGQAANANNTESTQVADNSLGCENRITPFTTSDYRYSLSKGELKLTTSSNFPIELDIEGDFTVDQTDPAWPFIFNGKMKGYDLYINQGLMMNKYDDACAKVMANNAKVYHDLVNKQGTSYWQKTLGETLIKNGQADLHKDGQLYYWYLVTDSASSKAYGGKYYTLLTYAYKNGIDYRFSNAFNGTSLDPEGLDLATQASLRTVSLFRF